MSRAVDTVQIEGYGEVEIRPLSEGQMRRALRANCDQQARPRSTAPSAASTWPAACSTGAGQTFRPASREPDRPWGGIPLACGTHAYRVCAGVQA
jgi:hypothetical protein